jgi:hypothetical protein
VLVAGKGAVGLVEEVDSAGGDEGVVCCGVGCREGVVVVQVSLDFPSASA